MSAAVRVAPVGRWQAAGPDGIAHLFFVATPGIGHAACNPNIRPVAERFEHPARARCLACLNHIEYGSKQGV